MISVRDLNLADLLAVCQRLEASEREAFETISGTKFDPEDAASHFWTTTAVGWIFEDPVKPVVACGFSRVRPGVFVTWFFAIEDAWHQHGREITEVTANLLREAVATGLAHRIETVTLANRSRACDWYEKIGLRFESTLRGYCANGSDAVRFVFLRGDV